MESDYLMLSEQYASFLVAVGGVSITVLALVLSFGSEAGQGCSDSGTDEGASRAFLVAALVVATVSCFIGAQMMAETAAFISHRVGVQMAAEKAAYINPHQRALPGDRLFLLASANIFIAIILLLFALMLLLTTSVKKVDAASMKPIALSIFGSVVIGALIWGYYAATDRMPAPGGWWCPIGLPVFFSVVWLIFLIFVFIRKKSTQYAIFKCIARKLHYEVENVEKVQNICFLAAVFIPITIFTVVLFLYFACTYDEGGKVHDRDIGLFSFAILSSYAALTVATIKTMNLTKPATL